MLALVLGSPYSIICIYHSYRIRTRRRIVGGIVGPSAPISCPVIHAVYVRTIRIIDYNVAVDVVIDIAGCDASSITSAGDITVIVVSVSHGPLTVAGKWIHQIQALGQ